MRCPTFGSNAADMKKAAIHIAFVFLLWGLSGHRSAAQAAMDFPAEELTLHLTQTCLFPGEVLGFKVYCTNPLYPELELSRMAFIEVVSDRNASILRKKILLTQGAGAGEFMMPVDLETGFYTVLAYTNWLKNFGEASFHKQRIMIINPDQKVSISDTCMSPGNYPTSPGTNGISNGGIRLQPDKTHYATREQVSLQLIPAEDMGQQAGGIFSVSVSRTEPMQKPEEFESSGHIKNNQLLEIEYLPDFTGIRLSGKLEDLSGNAMPAERIIISEPGPGTSINSTITDNEGDFHFLLEPQEGVKDLVFTLPENDAVIKLEEPYWNGFRNPPVTREVCLQSKTAGYLEERFYHFQIQQKFNRSNFSSSEQLDSILKENERFYTHHSRSINLDDYVLLDSLSEYFYELVPSVKFIQTRGKYEVKVLDRANYAYFEEDPGVFVDGVLYSDYNEIARIPVKSVENITVLSDIYYYRDFNFGGIVDLHTKKSDFTEVQLLNGMTRFLYPMASASDMKYAAPLHSSDSPGRIPDFRYLLCWEPEVRMEPQGGNTIQFYTGDVTGEFTVTVTGISPEGVIIKAETKIFVGQDSETKL